VSDKNSVICGYNYFFFPKNVTHFATVNIANVKLNKTDCSRTFGSYFTQIQQKNTTFRNQGTEY
jgi:hypothetical protein